MKDYYSILGVSNTASDDEIKKVERKERSQEELDTIITWLTGYSAEEIHEIANGDTTFEEFFEKSPEFNPKATMIKGVICGYRVEEIENPLMQKIRYLDKLVDELAKGKKMEKILRD